MKELLEEIKNFVRNKAFIICLILTAILSFGFGITHVSIGIDDLCFDRYVKGTWILSANRWGTWAFYNIFRIYSFTPFWLEFMTVIVYFITALVLCAIVKKVSKDKLNNISYILFGCGYISFPILSFQFVYQSTNITVALSNLILIVVVYLVFTNYIDKKNKMWFIPYILLSSYAIACYESCLQTYAVFALIITLLWVRYSDNKIKFKNIAILGIVFVVTIVISIGVYFGIASLVKMHLEKIGELHPNGAYSTTIFDYMKKFGKKLAIIKLLNDRYEVMLETNQSDKFVFVGLFGSLIFIVCSIINAIKNKRYHIIWLAILAFAVNLVFPTMFVSLLYRMYYSWTVMVGFEFLFIYETISEIEVFKKIKLDKIVFGILVFIILLQTKEMSNKIFEDYRANEEAKNRFILIGNTIKSYCNESGKPVVYKYKGLTMTSTFDWSINVFDEMGAVITQYINYNGFYIQNSGLRWEETLWMAPGDYENRRVINSYVSEGEQYIYVEINQE